jgi:hypothetical protein
VGEDFRGRFFFFFSFLGSYIALGLGVCCCILHYASAVFLFRFAELDICSLFYCALLPSIIATGCHGAVFEFAALFLVIRRNSSSPKGTDPMWGARGSTASCLSVPGEFTDKRFSGGISGAVSIEHRVPEEVVPPDLLSIPCQLLGRTHSCNLAILNEARSFVEFSKGNSGPYRLVNWYT